MLSFSTPPPIESLLTGLLNQIGAQSNRIVLVLDDYHLIIGPAIHDSITFILEHMSGNMQLVIVTRADPPLPLSRLLRIIPKIQALNLTIISARRRLAD